MEAVYGWLLHPTVRCPQDGSLAFVASVGSWCLPQALAAGIVIVAASLASASIIAGFRHRLNRWRRRWPSISAFNINFVALIAGHSFGPTPPSSRR